MAAPYYYSNDNSNTNMNDNSNAYTNQYAEYNDNTNAASQQMLPPPQQEQQQQQMQAQGQGQGQQGQVEGQEEGSTEDVKPKRTFKIPSQIFRHYRQCELGMALYDAITDLVNDDEFPEELANKTMQHYDMGINGLFSTEVRTKIKQFNGELTTYRFCENVWQFYLRNASFQTQGNPSAELIECENVHILAFDGSRGNKKSSKNKK